MDAVTGLMVSGLDSTGSGTAKGSKPPDMLKAITKPFTKLIVQIDKKVGKPLQTEKTGQQRDVNKFVFGRTAIYKTKCINISLIT